MFQTIRTGHQRPLWLLFLLNFRKHVRLQYILLIFFLFMLITFLHFNNGVPSEYKIQAGINHPNKFHEDSPKLDDNNPHLDECNFDETESLLQYKALKTSSSSSYNDNRPRPTVERLQKIFSILTFYEDKYRKVLDYLSIFRFTDLDNTLRPHANNTKRLHEIYCLFQRYIHVSSNGQIKITSEFINYLRQVSAYLSDGFTSEHPSWNDASIKRKAQKPVLILAANSNFYDRLQGSMRTVDTYFSDHAVAIYDLGFTGDQLAMIKGNCKRCMIISFPFTEFESVAPHVRNLGNFAWKPIIVQDAVRRFGTIIYGDTSVRYLTSDFERIIIDNLIRGFSCRELPGHYLACFTQSGTFTWFNETSSVFEEVYIAEAGFVAVTDNFLSRLVLKTWVTCALDSNCISPGNSRTHCSSSGTTSLHRFDQSAMVTVLSFYFFQSVRKNQLTNPAPYDMFSSIQKKVADVRRFESDPHYFTHRKAPDENKNSLPTALNVNPKKS